MLSIQEQLFQRQDTEYGDFISKGVPNLERELFIGVRVPVLRSLAKELNAEKVQDFLHQLPHHYYEENLLHAILISEIKDYDECLEAVERFLPYIDNWAVCDILSPKVFKNNRATLIEHIRRWAISPHVYTARFAMIMLMTHFLDGDFCPDYLTIAETIRAEDYYVDMGIAWFYATALAKQWEPTLAQLQRHTLTPWVHNKTIQKARESLRITAEQKEFLATLRRST